MCGLKQHFLNGSLSAQKMSKPKGKYLILQSEYILFLKLSWMIPVGHVWVPVIFCKLFLRPVCFWGLVDHVIEHGFLLFQHNIIFCIDLWHLHPYLRLSNSSLAVLAQSSLVVAPITVLITSPLSLRKKLVGKAVTFGRMSDWSFSPGMMFV